MTLHYRIIKKHWYQYTLHLRQQFGKYLLRLQSGSSYWLAGKTVTLLLDKDNNANKDLKTSMIKSLLLVQKWKATDEDTGIQQFTVSKIYHVEESQKFLFTSGPAMDLFHWQHSAVQTVLSGSGESKDPLVFSAHQFCRYQVL